MKEATGEFSMTVVTIVAIVVIGGVIAWLAPGLRKYVNNVFYATGNEIIGNGGTQGQASGEEDPT